MHLKLTQAGSGMLACNNVAAAAVTALNASYHDIDIVDIKH